MFKNVLKSVAVLALLWPAFEAGAQEAKRFGKHSVYCGSSEYEELLQKKYPGRATTSGFEEWLAPKVRAIKNKRLQRSGNGTNQVLTIPVVVHIIHNGDAVGANENISDEQVLSQITVLNQDYRRLSGTPGFNENPVGADTEIEFCLAQRDPNGLATTGITRHNYSQADWTLSDIDEIVKPETQWDPNLYLNLWVVKEINMEFFGMMIPGIKGYATFPSASGLQGLDGEQDIANLGGVVIGHKYFGSPEVFAGGTYENGEVRGRTASHEIGHFLGLRHIWGDGDCTMDDFCEDTPEAASATEGDCPSGQDTCPDSPGLDMVENYMDYSSEGCMNVFTQDQKDRMVAVLTNSPRRVSLTTSQACSPAVEHVNDGSLNIQEILLVGCSHTFAPTLKLFNAGTAALTSANITYSIDAGPQETYNWTGSLAHAQEAVITLPSLASTPGAHQFNASITSVNGGTDEEAYNNARSASFSIAANIDITELVIDVKQDFFGSETTWEVTNSAGTVVASGGPYEDLMDPDAELPVHSATVALENNQCYTFTIEDTGGNGIIGMLGEGYYHLSSGNGFIVGQGGLFTDSDSVSFGVNLVLDVNSPDVLEGITLYPVPSSDKITVVIPGNADVNTGIIYNNLGQLVNTVKVEGNTTIDISSLPHGVYYIKLQGKQQHKVMRFIKD